MILSRRARANAAGGLSSLIIFGFAVYGGLQAYKNWKSPYTLVNGEVQSYLIDKENNNRQPIIRHDGRMQVGRLEYRIEGIFSESKSEIKKTLDDLSEKYNLR